MNSKNSGVSDRPVVNSAGVESSDSGSFCKEQWLGLECGTSGATGVVQYRSLKKADPNLFNSIAVSPLRGSVLFFSLFPALTHWANILSPALRAELSNRFRFYVS